MVAPAPVTEARRIEPRWGSEVFTAVHDGVLLLEFVRRGLMLSQAATQLGFELKKAARLVELAWADEQGMLAAAENGTELTLERCLEVSAGVLKRVPMGGDQRLIDVVA